MEVTAKEGREVITVPGRALGPVDTLQKAFQTKGLEVGNAKLPEHPRSRRGAVKTESTTQRDGDELVEIMVMRLGGSPVLGSIQHLWDQDRLDKGGGDKRTRRRVASVDPGDEVGGVGGFGDDGVELLIPFAVALEDEAEVLVMIDEFDLVIVESDGTARQTRVRFVANEKSLGLDGRELQLPLIAPFLHVLEEVADDFELGGEGLVGTVFGPARTVVGEEGKNEVQLLELLVIQVVDVDGEEKGRQDAALRNTSRGGEPV